MPTEMHYGPSPQQPPRGITPHHVPALILSAFLVVALILAIAGGEIGAKTFTQPVPSPSDPITIP